VEVSDDEEEAAGRNDGSDDRDPEPDAGRLRREHERRLDELGRHERGLGDEEGHHDGRHHQAGDAMRRVLAAALTLLFMAGWVVVSHVASADTAGVGARAPDIAGGPWIGSAPLTIAGLAGRVTLVEFWTYG
jgi:hypothetical protein